MAATAFEIAPNLSRRDVAKRSASASERPAERSGDSPADEPVVAAVPFQRVDPDIVCDAIPAFFIGRNNNGCWVARDAAGKTGGIFLLRNSALAFARKNSGPAGCATIFPSGRFELDMENSGNRFARRLGFPTRLWTRWRRRMTEWTSRDALAATLRQWRIGTIRVLVMGAALAAIIALKIALYTRVFHYF